MEKSDISIYSKNDLYYIDMIGDFIRSNRLKQNKTQQQLAGEAGVNRSTLIQLESGKQVRLLSLIQVLRALKQLHVLNALEVKPEISPLMVAAAEQKQRIRVSTKTTKKSNQTKRKSDW
jgi:transcriptional regulator with XRE-family HTH domain